MSFVPGTWAAAQLGLQPPEIKLPLQGVLIDSESNPHKHTACDVTALWWFDDTVKCSRAAVVLLSSAWDGTTAVQVL